MKLDCHIDRLTCALFQHYSLTHSCSLDTYLFDTYSQSTMIKQRHPLDSTIIKLLQQQGLVKSEAKQHLKQHVYRLQPDEISKVKNYAQHFGIQAKQQLIDEILELRREALIASLKQNPSIEAQWQTAVNDGAVCQNVNGELSRKRNTITPPQPHK
ncbi:hypothetical protein VHP8226_03233 [Vibrio hippocampi]|uniref:Uncharacterized protein n=1 Tax=Vibrio hippocampi TaxID=654686 RepID=A0ABM8ZLQ9_9VIBR|nr:hypothetical protein VHP8226_03233 [Vibrio hippocampi]